MALSIDKVSAGGVDVPDRGTTTALRAVVYGRANFPGQELNFYGGNQPPVKVTADGSGNVRQDLDLREGGDFNLLFSTLDGQESSKRWLIIKA